MSRIYSNEIKGNNNQVEIIFECDRGTKELHINDELLTNLDVAQERAESIFLEQSYIHKTVTITTFHIDDVNVGDIIKYNNVLYRCIAIKETIKDMKAQMRLTLRRWE